MPRFCLNEKQKRRESPKGTESVDSGLLCSCLQLHGFHDHFYPCRLTLQKQLYKCDCLSLPYKLASHKKGPGLRKLKAVCWLVLYLFLAVNYACHSIEKVGELQKLYQTAQYETNNIKPKEGNMITTETTMTKTNHITKGGNRAGSH